MGDRGPGGPTRRSIIPVDDPGGKRPANENADDRDGDLTGLDRHEVPTRQSRDVVAALAAREASMARERQAAEPPEAVSDFDEHLPTRVAPSGAAAAEWASAPATSPSGPPVVEPPEPPPSPPAPMALLPRGPSTAQRTPAARPGGRRWLAGVLLVAGAGAAALALLAYRPRIDNAAAPAPAALVPTGGEVVGPLPARDIRVPTVAGGPRRTPAAKSAAAPGPADPTPETAAEIRAADQEPGDEDPALSGANDTEHAADPDGEKAPPAPPAAAAAPAPAAASAGSTPAPAPATATESARPAAETTGSGAGPSPAPPAVPQPATPAATEPAATEGAAAAAGRRSDSARRTTSRQPKKPRAPSPSPSAPPASAPELMSPF